MPSAGNKTLEDVIFRFLNKHSPVNQRKVATWQEALNAPPFDPEGSGYDIMNAALGGLYRESSGPYEGHIGSRNPYTGQILKGRQHPTFDLMRKEDTKMGYMIYKGKDGKYYSTPGMNPLLEKMLSIIR